ncbi:MAG: glycosyltransferase family 39 protein [Eubacterium sp.]|nr:glycosyltransferase family 39 protein [Eubacterium sp.]
MENALINGKIKSTKQSGAYKYMLLAAFALHLSVFIYFLIKKPVHIDEAMTILNANSIAKSGTDILGERLPIYFDTWLHGGQSPFATYLVALMIKLFGYSLFITRVPMFVFSMLGLMAFYKFLKEAIPENETLINIAFCLACISPWHLYSSAFTLDCNFLPHIAMFGLYFLVRGINTKKSRYFVFSMVFFGLGFYCYILSAIIIPTFLAILYPILLIKKRISIKDTIISVITIFIVAIPFILQGLVQFDIIDNFKLFGFSISKMEYYIRGDEVNLRNALENLGEGMISLIVPDLYTFNAVAVNSFNYTNSFGGIALLIGIIYLFIFKDKTLNPIITALSISTLISSAVVCSSLFYPTVLYRFNFYNYMFIMISAYGIYRISKVFKKPKFKEITSVLVVSSLILTSYCFIHYYDKNNINDNTFYSSSVENCLDFCEEKETTISVSCINCYDDKEINGQYFEREFIDILYHYINKKDFTNIEALFYKTGYFNNGDFSSLPKFTDDNSIEIINPDKEITQNCVIVYNEQLNKLKYNKNSYEIKDFGKFVVLYKK